MRRGLTGSNHKTAAIWNRGLVLQLLRRHGQLSRRQVADMVHLRGSTLTYIMRELMDRDIVRTAGKKESKGVGQKQVMLTINPDVGWVLGVGLRGAEASLTLVDAAGGLLDQRSLRIKPDLFTVATQLQMGASAWLEERGTPPGRMLGLGVGVPGVVDNTTGVVLRSTSFKATNVPLLKNLIDTFGVTAVVDHDACFGALAEAAEGASSGESHFVYLVINNSVRNGSARLNAYGSAFYLGSSVYRGAHFAAGELIDALSPPEMELSLEELAALDQPDAALSDRLADLADGIARPLAMIVNLIDVRMIVLAGTVRISNGAFLERIRTAMRTKVIDLPDRALQVVPAVTRDHAVARGAALATLAASDETFADRLLTP